MRRSLTPPRLTAGGLIELNMQSFSEVYIYLKLIFSRIIIKSLKKILVFSGNKTICFVLYSIKIDVKKKNLYKIFIWYDYNRCYMIYVIDDRCYMTIISIIK